MSAKAYLKQARGIDQQLTSKLAQVAALNDLAAKGAATLAGMPGAPNDATAAMEGALAKIIDMQRGLGHEINQLAALRREIAAVIGAVDNTEYKTLLEKRYLCAYAWERIAGEMHYSIDNLYRLHKKALAAVDFPAPLQ